MSRGGGFRLKKCFNLAAKLNTDSKVLITVSVDGAALLRSAASSSKDKISFRLIFRGFCRENLWNCREQGLA